eukprot:scaffold840_cov344-Pavlova_lutheri.AAC.35
MIDPRVVNLPPHADLKGVGESTKSQAIVHEETRKDDQWNRSDPKWRCHVDRLNPDKLSGVYSANIASCAR